MKKFKESLTPDRSSWNIGSLFRRSETPQGNSLNNARENASSCSENASRETTPDLVSVSTSSESSKTISDKPRITKNFNKLTRQCSKLSKNINLTKSSVTKIEKIEESRLEGSYDLDSADKEVEPGIYRSLSEEQIQRDAEFGKGNQIDNLYENTLNTSCVSEDFVEATNSMFEDIQFAFFPDTKIGKENTNCRTDNVNQNVLIPKENMSPMCSNTELNEDHNYQILTVKPLNSSETNRTSEPTNNRTDNTEHDVVQSAQSNDDLSSSNDEISQENNYQVLNVKPLVFAEIQNEIEVVNEKTSSLKSSKSAENLNSGNFSIEDNTYQNAHGTSLNNSAANQPTSKLRISKSANNLHKCELTIQLEKIPSIELFLESPEANYDFPKNSIKNKYKNALKQSNNKLPNFDISNIENADPNINYTNCSNLNLTTSEINKQLTSSFIKSNSESFEKNDEIEKDKSATSSSHLKGSNLNLEYCQHRQQDPKLRRVTLQRNRKPTYLKGNGKKLSRAWQGFKGWVEDEKQKLDKLVQKHAAQQRVGANIEDLDKEDEDAPSCSDNKKENKLVKNDIFFEVVHKKEDKDKSDEKIIEEGGTSKESFNISKHSECNSDNSESKTEFTNLSFNNVKKAFRKSRFCSETKKKSTSQLLEEVKGLLEFTEKLKNVCSNSDDIFGNLVSSELKEMIDNDIKHETRNNIFQLIESAKRKMRDRRADADSIYCSIKSKVSSTSSEDLYIRCGSIKLNSTPKTPEQIPPETPKRNPLPSQNLNIEFSTHL